MPAAGNAHARAQARYKARRRAKRLEQRQREALASEGLAERFLTAVVSWSGQQAGAVARTVALDAAAQLDALNESAEPERVARLRALAASWGVPGAIVGQEQDAARVAAASLVADALVAIESGKATLPEVRAGLKAAKVLGKRRPRLDERAFATWWARLASGAGGNETPPTRSTPCACSEFARPHIWGMHRNWSDLERDLYPANEEDEDEDE